MRKRSSKIVIEVSDDQLREVRQVRLVFDDVD